MKQEPMNNIDLTPFFALRRHLKIAHHISGRVRLRVGMSVLKDLGGVDVGLFEQILGAIEGIDDVRVNRAAGTVVIGYIPDIFKAGWWNTLIHGSETEAVTLLQRLLKTNLAPAVAAAQEEGL